VVGFRFSLALPLVLGHKLLGLVKDVIVFSSLVVSVSFAGVEVVLVVARLPMILYQPLQENKKQF